MNSSIQREGRKSVKDNATKSSRGREREERMLFVSRDKDSNDKVTVITLWLSVWIKDYHVSGRE